MDQREITLWGRLTPKIRVLCTVLMVVAIALTPNGRWWTWALYGGVVIAIAVCGRVNFWELGKRVAIEFLFIGVVLLGTLFREGGTVVWQWGWVRITTDGLLILGSVGSKAGLSLVMLNILVLTTSVPALLNALIALRVPPLLVAILATMHRYVLVLTNEFHSMRRAAISRNLMGNTGWRRLVVGHMIGSLFLRTYDRGDRIHQAMLSRGYTGLPSSSTDRSIHSNSGQSQTNWQDGIALTVLSLLLCVGQGL